MSRYARKLVSSAENAWDAKLNDNFANIFDRPVPLHVESGPLTDLETAFPAASNDQGLAFTDYDGTPANGKMLAVSNGTAWRHAAAWEFFNRLTPTAKSGAYTLTDADNYMVLTGASTYDLTLQAIAGSNAGRRILVKFNGTGVVTMKPTGGDTFDGTASFAVDGTILPGAAYEFVSDGAGDWQIFYLAPPPSVVSQIIPLIVAVGDEVSAIVTGTATVTFRVPAAFTVTGVRASLTTASTTGTVTVDINEGGTSILSTKLTIDATEKTSTTAAVAAVVSDASLADDAEITIDIDNAGSSSDAAGLKVTILGTM